MILNNIKWVTLGLRHAVLCWRQETDYRDKLLRLQLVINWFLPIRKYKSISKQGCWSCFILAPVTSVAHCAINFKGEIPVRAAKHAAEFITKKVVVYLQLTIDKLVFKDAFSPGREMHFYELLEDQSWIRLSYFRCSVVYLRPHHSQQAFRNCHVCLISTKCISVIWQL